MSSHAQTELKEQVPAHCCPYCKKEVGYLGRALAWLFGTGFHGCDFSNVKEHRRDSVRFEKEDGEIVPIKGSLTVNEPPLDRLLELNQACRPIYKAAHAQTVRNDTIEEIAQWHEREANRMKSIAHQSRQIRNRATFHEISAHQIRAMKKDENDGRENAHPDKSYGKGPRPGYE
ncbi:hypothetical protein [Brucella intermedia]|uniref:hypothetical protein n=1 Tax=Brucella intermedia TaxID=94625 RepID=UPI00224A6A9C|nr:hypothetical protein [Brucella intermedia]